MKATLVPLEGKGESIPLTRAISVLGRSPGCDIRIEDDSLSRRHAILVMTDGLVVVRDLITTNGTRVNGQRVKWAALMPNDRISFGAIRYRIELAPDTNFRDHDFREDSGELDLLQKEKSITDLFGSVNPLTEANSEEKKVNPGSSEWELKDDSQNTELGGWKPA